MEIRVTLVASEGKVIALKEDNTIIGKSIALGKYDSEINYIEIDE